VETEAHLAALVNAAVMAAEADGVAEQMAAGEIALDYVAELAEIKGRLVERLGPRIEQGGYALVLHPEPSSQDAANIINRSMDLGFDFDHIIVVDTPEKAKAYIANPEYNIVYFVNRLPGVDLQGPLAGLGIADVSGGVASVVPETAKDLEIWL
jgi:hypothetical protein